MSAVGSGKLIIIDVESAKSGNTLIIKKSVPPFHKSCINVLQVYVYFFHFFPKYA